jgi:hypothetical protein
MVSVVLGMLVYVARALVVVALVAVPARREGRDLLTERGEDLVGSLRERPLSLGRAGGGQDGSGEEVPERGSTEDASTEDASTEDASTEGVGAGARP